MLIKLFFDAENTGCNVGSWLKLIKIIKHPRLKLSLIVALLTKIDHKEIVLNPQTIYYSLKQMEKEFDVVFDESNNNNNAKTKMSKSSAPNAPTMQYPYLQKLHRRAASELTSEQNVELHLIALNAYMATFHSEELKQYWKNHQQNHAQLEKLSKQYRAETKAFDQTVPEPFDLEKMEKMQLKPLCDRVKVIGKDSHIYSLDVMNKNNQIILSTPAELHVIKKYRNDRKYIDLITAKLPKLHTKFHALFPTTDTAVSNGEIN